MAKGLALPLAAAVALAGIAGAWQAEEEPGADHMPTCGGFAPYVDTCTTGVHVIGQYFSITTFTFPPCGNGAGLSAPLVPCFVGDLQGVLEHRGGQLRRQCHVVHFGVPALDEMDCHTKLVGTHPLWGAVTTHTCYARSYRSSTNAEAGEGLPGALGDWRCTMGWHT